jgi:hypothetical protein
MPVERSRLYPAVLLCLLLNARKGDAMSFFAAPLDSYATRITSGVAYLGGLLMLPLLFAYLSNLRWAGLLIPVALAVSLALFLVLAYAGQPLAYHIEEKQLVIQRRWLRALKIPLRQISGVSLASTLANVPQKGLRFAFNPGVFGYQGPFYLAPYGRAFFLATSREQLVAIARLSAPSLIISPARPQAFLDTLRETLTERGDEQRQAETQTAQERAGKNPAF